jgi:hypothetical protein
MDLASPAPAAAARTITLPPIGTPLPHLGGTFWAVMRGKPGSGQADYALIVPHGPQFEQAFADHGLLPVQVFSYIAWRESRCRPLAINARWDSAGNIIWTLNRNGTYDSGLLQINSSWKTVTRKVCGGSIELLLTLDCNLRVARYLLDNGGLGHWSM